MIAVSDSTAASTTRRGSTSPPRSRTSRRRGSLAGLRGAEAITNEELLLLDCDVLAPCALEQVITADNAAKVKAKIICEGANGPTTPAADEILEDKGVLVLPDVLANAGGVVVSYFEWVQGLQEYFWKEDEVNAKLHDIVTRAFDETWHIYEERQTSMRLAAYGARGRARRRGDDDARALPLGPRSSLYHARGLPPLRAGARAGAGAAATSRVRARGGGHHGDPELEARYREWLPVVEIDGERPSSTTSTRTRSGAAWRPHKVPARSRACDG